MTNDVFVAQDKHGKCLCSIGSKFEVVTRKTREGDGLWDRCINCGLVVNRKGVLKEEFKDFYNIDYQKSNSFSRGKEITPKEHYDIAINSMKPVAEYLKPYLKNDWRVMDIGAATGEFLDLIKNYVAYCFGVEANNDYCQFMQEELGIDATSDDYITLELDKKFDLIVINATIDHMYNSLSVLDKIAYDLKPGGMIYIQTPNDNQALRKFLPEPNRRLFEIFMYQKAHYLSFSMKTLKIALKQAGFNIIETSSRHDYTLKNFLQWYYLGIPQEEIYQAKVAGEFFTGKDNFSLEINKLLFDVDKKFHGLLERHNAGELLCVTAKLPK
jgi:2-polyprenyl-3-methyl-5-hydroxy-6-metoxy-1,4-benzoquinol methylase